MDAFFGFIPGSVGETSALLILLGGAFLVFTKIGSWRIMLSAILGTLIMGLIFNGVTSAGWIAESSKFYALIAAIKLQFCRTSLVSSFQMTTNENF